MDTKWSFIWNRLLSIWTIPDLRNKILFTVGLLLVTRVFASITVPLSTQEQVNLTHLFGSGQNRNLGQLLGLFDVFSGGSLQTFSVAALGLAPYITATIVMQLLGLVAILPFVARVGGNQLLSSAALLIMVGVVLDTVRQLDAHMVMRNYSGFLS
jgi:preprotein translocase subunit SecY